jgi:hypothetical protein
MTLELPDDLDAKLREVVYQAGPPSLPMTCILRALLRWALPTSGPTFEVIIERAKEEAAEIRKRKTDGDD